MAKKITVASYDIDIESISNKITQIKNELSGKDLGSGLSKKLTKELVSLEKELASLEKSTPGSGASMSKLTAYGNKMTDVQKKLSGVISEMEGFKVSDKYLQENIASLRDYVKEVEKAKKEIEDFAKAKLPGQYEVKTRNAGAYGTAGIMNTAQKEMSKAAKAGNKGEVQNIFSSAESKIKGKMATAEKNQGKDSQTYKNLLADLEALIKLKSEYEDFIDDIASKTEVLNKANDILAEKTKEAGEALVNSLQGPKDAAQEASQGLDKARQSVEEWINATDRADQASGAFDQLSDRLKNLVSAGAIFGFLSRTIRQTIQDMLELDKQFNEIAIVSDYSTSEMWKSFDTVNKVAQEFGVETKNVIEVQNLYYHQGKSMAEVNKLTAQTLTLAKITGMDYADATSKLTAVLNAYNIAAEDAVRVTDTIAAMDTNAAISSEELMTALTKTASIAANAGMSLESTEVFLTKMIETTREAPENLGTALKTIIARFGEVKQEIDGEIIETADINRVDTALKSVGISLLDTSGQIRDLDQVFMELSSVWDGLDRNTQRYIATIAAGSRQQSRFIAMMENYDRTLELTNISQNSAGLGAQQLKKSQESLESSINRLKSSLQSLASEWVKAGVIKTFIEGINSLVNAFGSLPQVMQPIIAGLALYILKFKVINPLLLRYRTIQEGIIQGYKAEDIAAKLANQEKSKELLNIKNLVPKLQKVLNLRKLMTKQLEKQADAQKDLNNQENQAGGAPKGGGDGGKDEPELDFFDKKKKEIKDKVTGTFKKAYDTEMDNQAKKVKDKGAEKVKDKAKKEIGKKAGKEIGEETGKNIIQKLLGKLKGFAKTLITKAGTFAAKIASTIGTTAAATITAIVAAALLAALAIWKHGFKASLDDTKYVEKLTEAQDKYNNSLKEYNDLRQKSKKYKNYLDPTGRVKTNLSEEEKQEEQNLVRELVEEYPRLLDYIDEEGNYHLKNAEAIEKEIAAKEKMLEQAADTYTSLRIENAKKGIYTDTSTLAGQSMKNMQDYAATFGTEKLNKNKDLKEIAKSVDKGFNNFNKSGFYDIMEAYAKGEKSSFDEKDMSDLFAGDIGQTNWKEFLKLLDEQVYSQGKTLDERTMAELLDATGAYVGDQAEEVAKSFMLLDEQLGGMYSSLLEGAALENAEILIQDAKLQINTFDFQGEVGDELRTAIAKAAEKEAKSRVGEEAWEKKTDEQKLEATETVLDEWQPTWENASKEELADYEKLISEETIGGMAASTVTGNLVGQFSTEEKDVSKMEKALISYLSETAIEGLDEKAIEGATTEVILTLFNKVATMVEEGVELDNKFSEFAENFGADVTELKGRLTFDQQKTFMEKTTGYGDESQQSFFNMVNAEYSKQLATGDLEKANKLFNTLMKIDFSSDTSLPEATKLLKEFGYTGVDVANLFVTAMGNINNISMSTFEQTIETTQQLIEKTIADLEGMGALIEGTATSAQLSSYFDFMGDEMLETMDINSAVEAMKTLGTTITATGEGFKLNEEAAIEYGDQVVSSTQEAILSMMALQKAIMLNEEATAEARMEAAKSYAFLAQAYSQADAARQKAYWDGVIDNLEKVKEKAEEALEAINGLVSWMRDFDRFASLDGVIKDLENEFGHIEFEISFTTNADVVEKDIEKQITNANTRLAANRGGLAAAEDEQAMWRDTIQKRNSQYISFDANGNAILNHKEIQNLQEKMANADPETRKIYQAQYDEIMGNYDAYNKATDKVEEYSKAVEESMKDIEEIMTAAYENITKTQEKLIEVRMKQEDKELEKIKDKYEAIKEENDKYLESVKDMIDEERAIRDRADKEQDVKDKEKKLAMMKMDTSGVYSSDIRALEKELESDYRSLEDDAVDRAIEDMEKQFDAQAEAMDKEIEYIENTLEYKREVMTEYNEWAMELIESGSDAVLAYLKANDEEYYTGSAAQQALWEQEWNSNVALAVGSNEVLKSSLIQSVFNTLEDCKKNAQGFEGAVEEYSETAIANNGTIEGTVNTLTGSYEGLASQVDGVADAMNRQAAATERAAAAARELKNAQDASKDITGATAPDVKPTGTGNTGNTDNTGSTGGSYSKKSGIELYHDDEKGFASVWDPDNYVYAGNSTTDGKTRFYQFTYTDPLTKTTYSNVWIHEDMVYTDKNKKKKPYPSARWYKKYAVGGLADYTGPAWLDGTPSKPEMVLNPAQTQAFIKLVDVLDYINSPTSVQPAADYSKMTSRLENMKNEYNFNIEVSQMASDYDVDKLVNRIEEKMVKAAKFRQVTMVTKTK